MDDLVKATGVSRHGVYAEFNGKDALFVACLDAYRDQVVTPALAEVEAGGAGLDEIAGYFETQIARAELGGFPGPGCLIANATTELAPAFEGAWRRVDAHNQRLVEAFRRALRAEAAGRLDKVAIDDLSSALFVFAHGLWVRMRAVETATPLRRSVAAMLDLIRERIA